MVAAIDRAANARGPARAPRGAPARQDGSRSGAYTLLHEDPAALGQDGWRDCCKCEGLFHAPSGAGRCPAGGGHDDSRSGKYKVRNLD